MKATLLLTIFLTFIVPIARAEDIKFGSESFEAGRKVGMLQVTCDYGKMGRLSPDTTQYNISLFLNLISREHSWEAADFISWMTLTEHKPFCIRFWPEYWLPDEIRKN